MVHLDLLEKELKRVIRSGDDKLLEKILKELVNLVLVQIVLNRLHVVELLHLVHILYSSVFDIQID